ncbi:GAF domain-containing protein, partial [Desulfobacula phenolica]
MQENEQIAKVKISEDTLNKWQNIVDIMAELIKIPAALIMRLVESDIEVFISSQSEGNPYHPGDHECFLGSGLYCETVINTNDKLLIPNALSDEKWKNNPDVKLNMISYLGFPILLPDGKPFGTICVLDNKENSYSETYKNLIINFREIIQSQLELIYMNTVL